MSESEYKELILAEYDRQEAGRLLPSELLVPTPANIKAEIVKFCEQGSALSVGDEQILRSFVGARADVAAYRVAFQNGKADPFRQVVKLLTDRTVNTNIKYVNLLALLIGFKSRPYHPNMVREVPGDGPIIILPPPPPPPPIGPPKKNRKKLIIYIVISLAIVTGGYLAYKTVNYNERCMYWDDDHYQPIDCNETPPQGQSQQINRQLITTFKRITRTDTLTLYSVKKVWYINYNGKVEFFTTNGLYPPDTSRRLLPMTDHILKKYVYHIAD